MEFTFIIIIVVAFLIIGILFGQKLWRIFFKEECKHQWGPITDGYQYCTKCNLAKAAPIIPCQHFWEVESISKIYRTTNSAQIGDETIYICKKCSARKFVRTELGSEPITKFI